MEEASDMLIALDADLEAVSGKQRPLELGNLTFVGTDVCGYSGASG